MPRRCAGAIFYDTDRRTGSVYERVISCSGWAGDGVTRCGGCLFITQREHKKQVDSSLAGIQRMFDAIKEPNG